MKEHEDLRYVSDHSKFMITCKVLFLTLFFSCLIFYGIRIHYDHVHIKPTEEPLVLEDWTVVTDDGQEFVATDPYEGLPESGHYFTIYTTLPDVIKDDHFLCFLNFYDTEVCIGGEVRKDFVRSRDVNLPGGSVKASYFLVPVYEYDAGKVLSITRVHGSVSKKIYPETLFGTPEQLYKYLVHEYIVTFVMCLILLAFSALIIIAGLVLIIWLKRPIAMFYAGLAAFITTAWMITDSFAYPFIFGHYHIDGVMSYFFCMLLPIPFCIYMDSLQKGRHKKWYGLLQMLTIVSFVCFTVLHFTGIFPFYDALPYVDAVLVIDIIACTAITIADIVRGNVAEYRYTAIGFLGFMVLAVLQIILIFTTDLNNDSLFLMLGLLFLLLCVVLQQLLELSRTDLEKQRALELSDAKTRFLASMSHEIRTPINSILGMNEMILRENHDETIGDYARSVQSAGKMLLALINDVLDFSKIEAGKLEIANADFRLSELLAEIAVMARERASSKSLDFFLNIAGNVPDGLRSDEVRIKQILINLLTNAVKYTDRGNVTLEVSGDYEDEDCYRLRLDVRDTGKGIREEEQATLFDAFSRADLAQNRNVEGTGLGLAIVHSIVQSMGGEISVRSEYGKGSAFSVNLPLQVTDWTPVPSDPETLKRREYAPVYHCGYTAPDAKVLAVDDNAANLSIVRQFLKETGIQLDCCMNGDEALKRCTQVTYDLILLDHMMPDPDGIVTLSRIRSSDVSLNRDTKAVVLTANAIGGSRQQYLDAGFIDYLTKPIDSALLEETVKKYLPAEKVLEKQESVAKPEYGSDEANRIASCFTDIPGFDFDIAISYCGDSDVVVLVCEEIIKDEPERSRLLQEAMRDEDYEKYRIHAHAIKSNMATIGVADLEKRAKDHEFAGRDKNETFIREDGEAFVAAYKELCNKLQEALKKAAGE